MSLSVNLKSSHKRFYIGKITLSQFIPFVSYCKKVFIVKWLKMGLYDGTIGSGCLFALLLRKSKRN